MEGVDHLAQEESKAQFDVDQMKVIWVGSYHTLEVSDRIAHLIVSDPVFRRDNRTLLSMKDLFKNTLQKTAHAWKRITERWLSEEEAYWLRHYVDQPAYTDLH
ncbi:hypothetical protein ACFX15_031504 [Malus domestica]